MANALFRFYAELNDFLPRRWRQVDFEYPFEGRQSIKDMIEAIGAPHTEVDLILVNGESVDFAYQVRDGDRISVYPVFEAFDITPALRVRPEPLRVVQFVLDVHLGRLAAHLRMLGFNTLFPANMRDEELARISHDEQRILLTRDRGLLKRRIVTHGYCVRSANPREQVVEVVKHFDLFRMIDPFRRCMRCNGLLAPARKEDIAGRLPASTRQHYDEFQACRECGQVYWKGPHFARMQRLVEHVRAQE